MDENLARTLYRIIVGLAVLGLFFSLVRIAQGGIEGTALLGVVVGVALLLVGVSGLRRRAPARDEPKSKKPRKQPGSSQSIRRP